MALKSIIENIKGNYILTYDFVTDSAVLRREDDYYEKNPLAILRGRQFPDKEYDLCGGNFTSYILTEEETRQYLTKITDEYFLKIGRHKYDIYARFKGETQDVELVKDFYKILTSIMIEGVPLVFFAG